MTVNGGAIDATLVIPAENWVALPSPAVDSRSNRPTEAGSAEGGVLRWDAEGEAGGGAAHRGRARRLWRWEGEMGRKPDAHAV